MPLSKKVKIYYGGDVPEVHVFGEKVGVVSIHHTWVTETDTNNGNELLIISFLRPSDTIEHVLSYSRRDQRLNVDGEMYSDFEIITSAK